MSIIWTNKGLVGCFFLTMAFLCVCSGAMESYADELIVTPSTTPAKTTQDEFEGCVSKILPPSFVDNATNMDLNRYGYSWFFFIVPQLLVFTPYYGHTLEDWQRQYFTENGWREYQSFIAEKRFWDFVDKTKGLVDGFFPTLPRLGGVGLRDGKVLEWLYVADLQFTFRRENKSWSMEKMEDKTKVMIRVHATPYKRDLKIDSWILMTPDNAKLCTDNLCKDAYKWSAIEQTIPY